MLGSLLREHYHGLLVTLALKHLLYFGLLNSLHVVLVIQFDLTFETDKHTLDVGEECLEALFALPAALLASLLKIQLLQFAVHDARLDFEEIQIARLITSLDHWFETLCKHGPGKYEVLR